MNLKELLENASPDVLEMNKELIDSVKRSTKRNINDSAPAISQAEATFDAYWQVLDGPELIPEYRFDEVRKWRLDRFHEETRIAIEIHGATYSGGRHVRPKGFAADREKMAAAQEAGIRVYELVTPVDFAEVERVHMAVMRELARRRAKETHGPDSKGAIAQASAASQGAAPTLDIAGTRTKRTARTRSKGRKGTYNKQD